MPNPETGITPPPNGGEVHWSREEVTPEGAKIATMVPEQTEALNALFG